MMSGMTLEEVKRICDDVRRDRAAILTGRGDLKAEAALPHAV